MQLRKQDRSLPFPVTLHIPGIGMRALFTVNDVRQFAGALRSPHSYYAGLPDTVKVELEAQVARHLPAPKGIKGLLYKRAISIRAHEASTTPNPMADRLSLLFGEHSPLSHREILHHDQTADVISFDQPGLEKRWSVSHGIEDIDRLIHAEGKKDQFIAPNEFHGWRNIRLLESLRANFVDIDNSAIRLEDVTTHLTANRLPHPSFVVYSGRGLHLYWRLVPAPAFQLPLWQQVENALVTALLPLGADKCVKDCTRILRLAGTINSKVNKVARISIITGVAWALDDLAMAVLGEQNGAQEIAPRRDERRQPERFLEISKLLVPYALVGKVRSLEVARSKRRGTKKASVYKRWYLVHQDLLTIAHHHGPGGLKAARCRDKWLFLYAVALSWFSDLDSLLGEVLDAARLYSPSISGEQALKEASCVIQRAQKASRLQPCNFGTVADPRYRFKRSTLFEWMEALIPTNLIPKLRAIVPDTVAIDRANARWKARATGEYTKRGVRRSNDEKMEFAQTLATQGHGVRSIARQLSVSHKTIQNWFSNPAAVAAASVRKRSAAR
jgi:hypothetical protein